MKKLIDGCHPPCCWHPYLPLLYATGMTSFSQMVSECYIQCSLPPPPRHAHLEHTCPLAATYMSVCQWLCNETNLLGYIILPLFREGGKIAQCTGSNLSWLLILRTVGNNFFLVQIKKKKVEVGWHVRNQFTSGQSCNIFLLLQLTVLLHSEGSLNQNARCRLRWAL